MTRTNEDAGTDRDRSDVEAIRGYTFAVVAPLLGIAICLVALASQHCSRAERPAESPTPMTRQQLDTGSPTA